MAIIFENLLYSIGFEKISKPYHYYDIYKHIYLPNTENQITYEIKIWKDSKVFIFSKLKYKGIFENLLNNSGNYNANIIIAITILKNEKEFIYKFRKLKVDKLLKQ